MSHDPFASRQVIGRPNNDRGSDMQVPSRRRHAASTRSQALVTTHGARFTRFSAIGGGVFVAGLALQAALTSGLHVPSFLSYVVQAVVSIEASFLLNRWYTWNERATAFWPTLLRYNAQKTVTVAANLVLYAGLLKFGVNYLLANILLTAVFTVVNYVGGDRFVFTPGRTDTESETASVFDAQTIPFGAITATRLPTVSVVIPCRANEKTIRAAVDSLIVQKYPELRKIILVGSPGDSTWGALAGVLDPRVVILETETPPGIRDANFKRDLGIRETTTDLVALVDSEHGPAVHLAEPCRDGDREHQVRTASPASCGRFTMTSGDGSSITVGWAPRRRASPIRTSLRPKISVQVLRSRRSQRTSPLTAACTNAAPSTRPGHMAALKTTSGSGA